MGTQSTNVRSGALRQLLPMPAPLNPGYEFGHKFGGLTTGLSRHTSQPSQGCGHGSSGWCVSCSDPRSVLNQRLLPRLCASDKSSRSQAFVHYNQFSTHSSQAAVPLHRTQTWADAEISAAPMHVKPNRPQCSLWWWSVGPGLAATESDRPPPPPRSHSVPPMGHGCGRGPGFNAPMPLHSIGGGPLSQRWKAKMAPLLTPRADCAQRNAALRSGAQSALGNPSLLSQVAASNQASKYTSMRRHSRTHNFYNHAAASIGASWP